VIALPDLNFIYSINQLKMNKMKIKSMFITFTLKALMVAIFITLGFAGFTKCDAQSIVGKWNGVSVRNYFSAEYAKVMGKPMEEKSVKEAGNSAIEYKSDHTFIMTFSALNNPEVTTMKGVWSLTGDQLKSTLEPKFNPRKMTTTATVEINGNTMVTTAVMPAPSRISKTISTGTKM
jgi:Lipocalin-like domain